MKKIIAREFLVFLVAIISFLPLHFIWNLIQERITEKIISIHKEIANNLTTDFEKNLELLEASRELRASIFLNASNGEKILYLSIFIFSILFLMRYLFYAVKWSIIQLKEK